MGRYVILDRIGAGGMGVVFGAYDPELDRKLALKLLRNTSDVGRDTRRRHRLIREAQAMARLSHPHVITVHDVGTIDERVFVAMEFLDGFSLAEWMKRRRTWEEVVEIYVQAGEGLAAAHGAGLVHRDFKPDNVMLTHDGRVVVTDFGLAREAGVGIDSGVIEAAMAERPGLRLATTVTAAGAIMGTPAYMSPEQHEGREVDARSDQFAFAVALYEALYGQRPFAGKDIAALALNVSAGNVRPTPQRSGTPGWIRKVLLRALSVQPTERYASMESLLADLARGGQPRRWPTKIVAAGVGGVGLAAAAVVLWQPDPEPCRDGGVRAQASLGPNARARAKVAFAESSAPYARASWPAVEEALGAYAKDWTQSYDQVCRATQVDEAQSEELLRLRTRCLQRRLADASALVELLVEADDEPLRNALVAVHALRPPRGCEGILVSPADSALESDDRVRGSVDALVPHLAKVAALDRTASHERGVPLARDLVGKARAVGHGPVIAEATLHLASLQLAAGDDRDAEEGLRRALATALESRADAVAADAASMLAGMTAPNPDRASESLTLTELAEALATRSDPSGKMRVDVLLRRGQLLTAQGRSEEARVPLSEAYELVRDAHGANDGRVATVAAALGAALGAGGHLEGARELMEEAIDITQATSGERHPRVAMLTAELGKLELQGGRAEEARALLAGALAMRAPDREPDAQWLSTTRATAAAEVALGLAHAAKDRLERAALQAEASPRVAGLGPHLRADAAAVALMLGDAQAALDHAREAQRSVAQVEPGYRPSLRGRLGALAGDALLAMGRTADARAEVEASLGVLEARLGESDPRLWRSLQAMGELSLATGDAPRAIEALERARACVGGRRPHRRARTEFALARARAVVESTDPRADRLARSAATHARTGSAVGPLQGHIEAWIEERSNAVPKPAPKAAK